MQYSPESRRKIGYYDSDPVAVCWQIFSCFIRIIIPNLSAVFTNTLCLKYYILVCTNTKFNSDLTTKVIAGTETFSYKKLCFIDKYTGSLPTVWYDD